jgi:hypothetical protein
MVKVIEGIEGLVLDPRELYDEAIIGICYRSQRAIYSIDKLVEIEHKSFLKEEPKSTIFEAIDHVHRNIVGAYMGDLEPIYVESITEP